MAAATSEELSAIVGSVPTTLANSALAMALRRVKLDGVSESHESFADLQVYWAAHIIEVAGGDTGKVLSRSVGDVSVSRGQAGEQTTWFRMYRSLLADVTGLTGRLA